MRAYLENPFVLLAIANAIIFGVLLGQRSLRNPGIFLRYAFLFSFLLSTLWASLRPRTETPDGPDLYSTGKELWRLVMNFQEILVAIVILFVVLLATSGKLHPTKNTKLASAALALFAATAAIGTIFTAEASWSRGLVIPTAFMVALLMYGRPPLEEWSRYIVFGLALVIIGSLVALVVSPEWALSGRGDGLFNLDGRLVGLSRHPNALGYLAVLLIVITWWSVTSRRVAIVLISASIAVLILTVSRTAWVAAIAAFSTWIVFRFFPKMSTDSRIFTSFGVLGFGAAIVISGVWLGFISLEDRVFFGATTLTGRTYLWGITWDLWKGSPFFGYGTDAWSIEWREHFGLPWAGQAHNQFFDTLITAGVLGVLALFFLIGVLLKLAIDRAETSRGASVALVGIFLIRGITESSLGSTTFDQMFFSVLILFLMLVLPENRTKKGKASSVMDDVNCTNRCQ